MIDDMNMFDVICIGNLNFDIIFNHVRFPDIHEKIRCEDVFTGLGGAAGNTAAWLARLGHRVGFVGCVGNDPAGREHLSEFERLNIDISQIKVTDKNTGLAVIFSSGNDKRMVKSTGANSDLRIDETYLRKTGLVHLSGNRKAVVERVIDICKRNDIKVSWDPGETQYKALLDSVDYLILNEDEARRMANTGSIEEALSVLPADICIITKNHGGCVIVEKGKRYSIDGHGAPASDTTGAGDAFDAGFIHGLLNERSMEDCGRLGVAAASQKVLHGGARSGSISSASLEAGG